MRFTDGNVILNSSRSSPSRRQINDSYICLHNSDSDAQVKRLRQSVDEDCIGPRNAALAQSDQADVVLNRLNETWDMVVDEVETASNGSSDAQFRKSSFGSILNETMNEIIERTTDILAEISTDKNTSPDSFQEFTNGGESGGILRRMRNVVAGDAMSSSLPVTFNGPEFQSVESTGPITRSRGGTSYLSK